MTFIQTNNTDWCKRKREREGERESLITKDVGICCKKWIFRIFIDTNFTGKRLVCEEEEVIQFSICRKFQINRKLFVFKKNFALKKKLTDFFSHYWNIKCYYFKVKFISQGKCKVLNKFN